APPPHTTPLPYTTLFRSGQPPLFHTHVAGLPSRFAPLGQPASRCTACWLHRKPHTAVCRTPARPGPSAPQPGPGPGRVARLLSRSEEHTSELQSRENLVC